MRKPLLVIGIILISGAIACGQAARPGPSGGNGDSAGPKAGGTLSAQTSVDPTDFDLSYQGKSGPAGDPTSLAYDSLLGYKTGPEIAYDELVLQPELAERWEVAPDATSYTFHLRKGVKFANLPPVNGRELTSDDVKWSFEYWSRTGQFKDKKLPEAQFDWMFEGLDQIETPDSDTVVVRFKEPYAPFLNLSGADYIPVVPHEIYDEDGSLKDRMVGTGPFQLDTSASQKGTRWVYKKNPTYWQPGKPYIDQVRLLVIPDDAAAQAAFQTKQLDWLGQNIRANAAEEIKKSNPDAVAYEFTAAAPQHLYMNFRKAPLNDLRVRKAVAYAIDRDELVRVLSQGKGKWALAGAFPDTFSQEEVRRILRFDPAESRRLLGEAGFPDGVSIPFEYPGNAYGDQYITQMTLLQSQLKKVGIDLQFNTMDKNDYSALKKKGAHTFTITSKSLEGDVDSYLYAIFHPKSKANYDGVDDPRLTELVVAQRREPDPAKRQEIVRNAVRLINSEALSLALIYDVNYEFWWPQLKHYAPNFGHKGLAIANSWLDR